MEARTGLEVGSRGGGCGMRMSVAIVELGFVDVLETVMKGWLGMAEVEEGVKGDANAGGGVVSVVSAGLTLMLVPMPAEDAEEEVDRDRSSGG